MKLSELKPAEHIILEFQKPFSLDNYDLFLKAKKLPEANLKYDYRRDVYVLTTHRRFAGLLGIAAESNMPAPLQLPDFFRDYQRFIVSRALNAERYAIYADCGLGKTLMQLEFARQATHLTNGKALILCPLQIIPQTIEEQNLFYPNMMSIIQLRTREDLRGWLQDHGHEKLGITNYEKMVDGELPELNELAALIADESSIFKTGGGVIKWNILHSINGSSGMSPAAIPFRLSCTATPAPNDIMEYASQASYLGKLRNEGDILWTYFQRDKRGNWQVKPYAEEGFYRFLSSWSIYLRDPKAYGFHDVLCDIPQPDFHEIDIEPTPEQMRLEADIRKGRKFEGDMFGALNVGVVQRMKLSQIAKGFIYTKTGAQRVESRKPTVVADIIRQSVKNGHQVLVWTVFDEEGDILLETLDMKGARNLTGKMRAEDRISIIEDFRHGKLPVLMSKPELLGFGLNFQFCDVMVFNGWNDSYEQFYQAWKRIVRPGQKKRAQIYIPQIKSLEGMIWENIQRKRNRHEEDAARQEIIFRKIIMEEIAA